jgi:two-component system phosphate regulon sensor histidine kinase PhoR
VGDTAAGGAHPSQGGVPTDRHLEDDVVRIARSVRDVVDARAAIVSRVVDDEWLEVMTVVGEPSEGIVRGLRWRRSDLDLLLGRAEEVGRLRATKHRAVSYVEVPDSTPETQRYVSDHLGLLIAPLRTPEAELVGVLATEGPVETTHPSPGTCELVELYADQARLALVALRDQAVLTRRLQLSDAAQAILSDAASADDMTTLLDAVSAGLRTMMRARAAWVCTELEPGVPAEASSYPVELGERLQAHVVCALLQPMMARCLRDRTALSGADDPVLQRLAGVAELEQVLTTPIGDGAGGRGALLVLRGADDDIWSEDEREALVALGRRLGTMADQVLLRQRDHESVKELRRLDEYRRDLVASITHDLKTPLTAIALNTELLESDKRLAEAGSHPVGAIRRSADRLAGLVDDLLAMARAEDDADTRAEIDLVSLVRDACAHAETEAALRGVTFDIEAPEELWVLVDATALARVFANLVGNAVKFSLPRGRVTLSLGRTGDVVEFRCTDEGIGIPEGRLATIFDLGQRSPDSRMEELPGSGIGLAISQRIVTRLGGTISVESEQGQGSTFTVMLPTA